ncbi:magnesium protoporphyrin IX methyltransferase [Sphingomonas humi]|uniref:Magnesium protoporphyrin IX methyltransferase n=2 Tax=Sphingomonas humi TaxID=335630 RepID=A0ABP7RUX5_9SPHN
MASRAAPITAAPAYAERREALRTYFDRTARRAWIDLTSDAKVSRIRRTVRAGRDEMRETLLGWLPADLSGRSLLDAGCGTGALAEVAADRGAAVTGVDVAAGLIEVAEARSSASGACFHAGDMLDPAYGEFDHVVAMDSLIHYRADDLASAVTLLAARTRHSLLFTFAPGSRLLAAMLAAGQYFPRADRSPAIVPIAEREVLRRLANLPGWRVGRGKRVARGFYTSHAVELVRER